MLFIDQTDMKIGYLCWSIELVDKVGHAKILV
jgi:hypothetical protein